MSGVLGQCPECKGDGSDSQPYQLACSKRHEGPFRDAHGYYQKTRMGDIPCTRAADTRLQDAAQDMWAVLDELEGAFDKEIYPEQAREDFDAPDDREYSVTITAKQWRAIGRALSKAGTR